MNLVLEQTFYNKGQVKKLDRKVVVLIGRSNVGKSSFINSISGRKALARISKTAGKTLSLNCYLAGNKYYVVDFPGYGYAKRSHEILDKMEELCTHFLQTQNVDLCLVLIDSRHPLQKNDKQMIEYLNTLGLKIVLVATKCDKLKSKNELSKRKRDLMSEVNNVHPLFFHSSVKKIGNKEIQYEIEKEL